MEILCLVLFTFAKNISMILLFLGYLFFKYQVVTLEKYRMVSSQRSFLIVKIEEENGIIRLWTQAISFTLFYFYGLCVHEYLVHLFDPLREHPHNVFYVFCPRVGVTYYRISGHHCATAISSYDCEYPSVVVDIARLVLPHDGHMNFSCSNLFAFMHVFILCQASFSDIIRRMYLMKHRCLDLVQSSQAPFIFREE